MYRLKKGSRDLPSELGLRPLEFVFTAGIRCLSNPGNALMNLSRNLLLLALAMCCSPTMSEEPTGKKYLIIHADDAGMCNSVNRGTIQSMDTGFVSSASIMVPCGWFPEYAAHCRQHPDGDYGIHLTLTSEWDTYRWGPVAPREKVPSLVDKDGYMWGSSQQVAQHAKVEEAEIELRAQIDRAKQFGIPLSHLDTHMGSVMTRTDLVEMYVKLGIEYDLPVMFIRPEGAKLLLKVAYPHLAKVADKLSAQLAEHRLPQLDLLHQFYEKGEYDVRRDHYMHVIRSLKPGVTQIIIHCGFDNEELQAVTTSSGLRDSDRQIFSDPDVLALIKAQNVEITTWKKLTEMERQ
jgi:predicted glycoside hydrolase/deacetylase ChbG (UPF0249 family)